MSDISNSPYSSDDEDENDSLDEKIGFGKKKYNKKRKSYDEEQEEEGFLDAVNNSEDFGHDDDDEDDNIAVNKPILKNKNKTIKRGGGGKKDLNNVSNKRMMRFVSSTTNTKIEEPNTSSSNQKKDDHTAIKTNADFRKLVQKSEDDVQETIKIKAAAAMKRSAVLPEPPKNIGTWEKHTKGFGAKMLNKFGFTGRLGANESGVSRAIEVSVRPSGVGLGFGGITEASALPVNKKLEAEWRGVEYIEEIKGKSKKEEKENLLKSESWKKGREGEGRKKVKKLNAVELLMMQAMNDKSEIIVDMRGRNGKILQDVSEINTNNIEVEEITMTTKKPELGQELLYNINTLLEVEDFELKNISRKLHHILIRSKALSEDVNTFQKKIDADTKRLDRIQRLQQIVSKIQEKIMSTSDVMSISVDSLCQVIITMFESFPEEFFVFGIINLVPLCASSLIKGQIKEWKPLEDPYLLVDMLASWEALEQYFKSAGKPNLSAQIHEMVRVTIETNCMPIIRRILVTEWNICQTNNQCTILLKVVKTIVNAKVYDDIVDNSILPKLTASISNWVPSVSSSAHSWIIDWIPIIGSKISSLFPEIRRKISQAISSWDGINPLAFHLVQPWKGYFDETSYLNLLFRVVIPKIIHALRSLVINPQNQDISVIQSLLQWYQTIPLTNLCALLVGEFFPNWLNILYLWLTSASPNFEEITEWYLGWKSLFPEEICEEPSVKQQFHTALDMMEVSLSGDIVQHPHQGHTGVQANSYVAVMEKINIENQAVKRLAELKRETAMNMNSSSITVTFKEVVEEFAVSRNIEFAPKEGKLYGDKPVWSFGSSLVYFDQNVVFVYSQELRRWHPIGLEELAALSE